MLIVQLGPRLGEPGYAPPQQGSEAKNLIACSQVCMVRGVWYVAVVLSGFVALSPKSWNWEVEGTKGNILGGEWTTCRSLRTIHRGQ